ncbi:3-dehydroquinate synthase [Lichenicoccus roseus]|uniref:Multifunctional fusion protein n=1 Tax=Lichenicoccus roseus TaxID=2683649 RepID=A0A5R9J793_9PROT|nr:3-dehydroquinate synthase [Lichenicoccus roseus]TLU72377.1 3-dehydroquinate synthase [Lichenicoccus roseus]
MSRDTAAANIPLEASLDEPLAVRRAVTDAAALAATMRAATTRAALAGRSVVLVGLMGAGKTTIGKRLATKLQLPFHDADAEIERAAGCSIAEMFERWGETAFRAGERRVIRRLLEGGPMVLATGGGAYMDPLTRALIRTRAVSVWLRCPLEVLAQRVAGRHHRPLLAGRDAREVLRELMAIRHPTYEKADLVIDCDNDTSEETTRAVLGALAARAAASHEASSEPPVPVHVPLRAHPYDILVGRGVLAQAGALLAPLLPQRRGMIVTDETVAALHLPTLQAALAAAGIECGTVVVPPGEATKSLRGFGTVTDALLAAGVERRCSVIALGGGVVGDLAGFAAASVLRGLPFVQIPTTLLSQVDSSVGGKTGINTVHGKNLLGAFHQPIAVLVDTAVLDTLPPRELRAGYAEIIKAGLIGDAALFEWCLHNGAAIVGADTAAGMQTTAALQAEAIRRACRFKADVVADDERETASNGGRALLNLGHTFAHALEAELLFDGRLLHGEAVAIGLGLALRLSAELGHCSPALAGQVVQHLEQLGMHARISTLSVSLGTALSAARLAAHMQRDKKLRDGRIGFVLLRQVADAFTSHDVDAETVQRLLVDEGCIT